MKNRYTFTLDPQVIEALTHMAEAGHRSRSSMIESSVLQTFDKFIESQQPKLEIRKEALEEIKNQ